jgi:hypothetical protein
MRAQDAGCPNFCEKELTALSDGLCQATAFFLKFINRELNDEI